MARNVCGKKSCSSAAAAQQQCGGKQHQQVRERRRERQRPESRQEHGKREQRCRQRRAKHRADAVHQRAERTNPVAPVVQPGGDGPRAEDQPERGGKREQESHVRRGVRVDKADQQPGRAERVQRIGPAGKSRSGEAEQAHHPAAHNGRHKARDRHESEHAARSQNRRHPFRHAQKKEKAQEQGRHGAHVQPGYGEHVRHAGRPEIILQALAQAVRVAEQKAADERGLFARKQVLHGSNQLLAQTERIIVERLLGRRRNRKAGEILRVREHHDAFGRIIAARIEALAPGRKIQADLPGNARIRPGVHTVLHGEAYFEADGRPRVRRAVDPDDVAPPPVVLPGQFAHRTADRYRFAVQRAGRLHGKPPVKAERPQRGGRGSEGDDDGPPQLRHKEGCRKHAETNPEKRSRNAGPEERGDRQRQQITNPNQHKRPVHLQSPA